MNTPTITAELIPTAPHRWGQHELEILGPMLDQPSLFYWNNHCTRLLTERFQAIYPLEFVMPCSSGTAAIHIALAAAAIAPGDEVITTPITDMGTVIGILYQQGVPVFADVEPHSYNLDPADVERKITSRTKAIIAVHLAGNPCDMDALGDIARRHDLVLIEDAAQAWGAEWKTQPVGTLSDIACFSLNDYKHISCGDGGIVATNNPSFGPRLQKFADKGYDRVTGSRTSEILAPCYRMAEPQSAIAAAQMPRVPEIARKRNELGMALIEQLDHIPGINPQQISGDAVSTFWFTMFRLEDGHFRCTRDEFAAALREEGLAAGAGYIPVPVYRFKVFQEHNFFAGHWPVRDLGLTSMDYTQVHCPVAEEVLQTAIRIEVKEWFTEEYIDLNVSAIRKVAEAMRA